MSRSLKIVYDVRDAVHGHVAITGFAESIINTNIFKRLKYLKQLGSCQYEYNNAHHSRYEHSIGTYYLTDRILRTIELLPYQHLIDAWLLNVPELANYYKRENITKDCLTLYVKELIKIGGLCHDIGHGPFSHLFDDHFLAKYADNNNPNITHEKRSELLIDMLLPDIPVEDVLLIKSIINPNNNNTSFIHQIVSNNLNGIDVDKMDYLMRDIKILDYSAKIDISKLIDEIHIVDNKIVYPINAFDDIDNLFRTRYRMYRNIYNHYNVISSQKIILDIMHEINNIVPLTSYIDDMNKFITITDNTIIEFSKIINCLKDSVDINSEIITSIEKIEMLLEELNKGSYNKLIYSVSTKQKINVKSILNMTNFNDSVYYFQFSAGFLNHSKPNPFRTTYFFNYENYQNIFTIDSITKSLPVLSSTGEHYEHVTLFYYKGNDENEILTLKEFLASVFI